MVLIWAYSWSASMPFSRPYPLALNPPNGVSMRERPAVHRHLAGVDLLGEPQPTATSPLHTLATRPYSVSLASASASASSANGIVDEDGPEDLLARDAQVGRDAGVHGRPHVLSLRRRARRRRRCHRSPAPRPSARGRGEVVEHLAELRLGDDRPEVDARLEPLDRLDHPGDDLVVDKASTRSRVVAEHTWPAFDRHRR